MRVFVIALWILDISTCRLHRISTCRVGLHRHESADLTMHTPKNCQGHGLIFLHIGDLTLINLIYNVNLFRLVEFTHCYKIIIIYNTYIALYNKL